MTFPLYQYREQSKALGHSEDFTRDTSSYAEHLSAQDLPVIFSSKHLALLLDVNPLYLARFINVRSEEYKVYKLRKKRGGYRWIQSPSAELKNIQKWIKKFILDKIPLHESANGFIKGKSIYKNALPHSGHDIVLNVDLYHFFDTITEKRTFGVFKNLGYHGGVSRILAELCCAIPPKIYWKEIINDSIFLPSKTHVSQAVLPQGAPTSPSISNLVCRKLDLRFFRLATKLGANYTRYADDLTFSGTRSSIPSLNTVRTIVSDEGFYLNDPKTSYKSKNKKQMVTGLTVNQGIHVPQIFIREVSRNLYFSEKYGPYNHLLHLGIHKAGFKEWILGKIFFVYSIDKKKGKKMFEQFAEIEWGI
ncbi:MAG: reverse transcriptase family protein [Bacteroidota bacterium]